MNLNTSDNATREISTLGLAHLGDAVYELLTREYVATFGYKVNDMHKETVNRVCAAAQATAYDLLTEHLTEKELSIIKRGRNSSGNVPKNADTIAYRKATGVEALFGWLYLGGETDRINELYRLILENTEKCE